MAVRILLSLIVVITGVITSGCQAPSVPPEVKKVEIQEINLRRAESSIYAPIEYNRYRKAYRLLREEFFKEKNRFAWFRSYKSVKADFSWLLGEGDRIEKLVEKRKHAGEARVQARLRGLADKIENIKDVTLKMKNEGRYARASVVKAELTLKEAQLAFGKGQYKDAMSRLDRAEIYVDSSKRILKNLLDRYTNRAQVARWQKWINETLNESKRKRIPSIIVNKIDRELILYKNGKPVQTYRVGLGQNGLQDKRHAGDNATPEGRYRIVKKIPRSLYHKALLIDYPNEEDKRIFAIARRKGLVPLRVGIGGLVEIHGGGISFMTRGCVSLENDEMDELYDLVAVGTPVTIVGSVDYPHDIMSSLTDY